MSGPGGRRLAMGATLLAAIAAAAAGCGKAADTSSTPAATAGATSSGGATTSASSGAAQGGAVTTPAASGPITTPLVWAVYRETQTLDPIFAFDYPENTVDSTLCDTLLRQAPDGTIGPGLATDISNPDPKTYLITLRPGVKFWDGTPLTADDVVYDLGRARNAKLGGYYAAVFSRVTSIAKTGPLEVTMKLSQPDYWLRNELASTIGFIYSKAYAIAKGAKFGTVDGGTMCTGPFKLKSWHTGQGVTVVKNDAYWDAANAPKASQITFKGVPDDAAVTSGLETGEISGYYAVQLTTLTELEKSSAVKVSIGPAYLTDALIISSLKGALKDVRVRRALSMAIDRPGLIAATYKGAATLPRALGNPGTWGYAKDVFQAGWDALPDPTVDIAAAKKLVQDAGATGMPLVLGTSAELKALNTEATAVQSAANAIGLKASLKSVSAANYIGFFTDPKARAGIDGFFTNNYPDYADPAGLYQTLVLPDGSQNYDGYANPAITAAMNAARSEADPTKRAQDDVAAQKIMATDLPWIPVALGATVLITNRKITGAPSSFQYMFGPWANGIGAAG